MLGPSTLFSYLSKLITRHSSSFSVPTECPTCSRCRSELAIPSRGQHPLQRDGWLARGSVQMATLSIPPARASGPAWEGHSHPSTNQCLLPVSPPPLCPLLPPLPPTAFHHLPPLHVLSPFFSLLFPDFHSSPFFLFQALGGAVPNRGFLGPFRDRRCAWTS